MNASIELMYVLTKLEAEALEAETNLAVAKEREEANDYSDAMESMERTYAEGFSDALDLALRIVKEGK